jgi:hypothetical protein
MGPSASKESAGIAENIEGLQRSWLAVESYATSGVRFEALLAYSMKAIILDEKFRKAPNNKGCDGISATSATRNRSS